MKDISTLTNITGNYLKTGNSPRFFVHVATSERKWATATSGDYTNRIQSIQSITDEIGAFGGMGTVSAANVDVLKLGVGEEIKFYTSASLFPRYQGTNVGAGRIVYSEVSYPTVRGSVIGSAAPFTRVRVGQTKVLGAFYYIYRGFLQFNIPAELTSCEEAYIKLTGQTDASDTDFNIYVVHGTWVTDNLGAGDFSSFSGWVEGGISDFTGTIFNEPFITTTQFSLTGTNYIRLNRAGRQQIVDDAGSVLKLMLLSSRDYYYPYVPTGHENVEFAVSVDDNTPTLELIYNTVKPDNERARIYLCYNDVSDGIPSLVSDMLNVWSGVVDSWSLDQRLLSLSMRHDDFKFNRKLTTDILTTDEFIGLPKENIGKGKSLIIGDFTGIEHERRLGSFLNETDTNNRYGGGDFVKGYICGDRTAIFADHALKTAGFFWAIWESSLSSFVLLCGNLTEESDGIYSITEGNPADFPYRMILNDTVSTIANTSVQPMQSFVLKHHADFNNSGAEIDGANAANLDYSDWALLDSNVVGLGDTVEYQHYSPAWNISNMQRPVAIIVETLAENGYVSNAVRCSWYLFKEDGSALAQVDNYINTDGQHIYYFEHSDLCQSRVETMVNMTAVKDISAKPCKFRNICVCKAYNREIPNEIFMKCAGVADDINGTYTGIPTTQPVIENPSDVIRWFAMVKGTLIASDIDSSFNTARTNLSDWKFAFQWSDDMGIDNLFNYMGQTGVVDELAAQCNATVWWNHLGKLSMKVFDATSCFPTSGTDVPDDLDIFEYEGSPSSGSLTRHPIYSFNLDRITMDETYNDFVLKYAQNYATGDYNSVLTIDNGLGVAGSVSTNITATNLDISTAFPTGELMLAELKALTSACYNDINTTNTLTFEAWAIRDEATATKLLQCLVQWHARRRFKVTLTTGLNAIAFELGDFINVRTDDIEDQFGTAFMNYKKWMITKISTDLVGCKITIDAIEAEIY